MTFLNHLKTGLAGLVLATAMALPLTPALAANIKFGTPTPPPHIFTKAAERFAEIVAADKSLDMSVKVFPSNRLGDVPTTLSLLQSGAAQFTLVPVGALAQRNDAFYGWFLPYMFPSLKEAGAAAALPEARQMLTLLEEQGLVGMAYIFPGQRHLLSKTAISSPADLKGLKVRAFPNDIFHAWWSAVGAAPTALPLPQIMPSLVTGVIDAVDVDVDIVIGLKMHKQAKHLILTNHMAFPGAVLISKVWWDNLDAAKQKRISKIWSQVEAWALETQIANEAAIISKLEADGAEVNRIDASVFAPFAKAISDEFIARDPAIAAFAAAVAKQ